MERPWSAVATDVHLQASRHLRLAVPDVRESLRQLHGACTKERLHLESGAHHHDGDDGIGGDDVFNSGGLDGVVEARRCNLTPA